MANRLLALSLLVILASCDGGQRENIGKTPTFNIDRTLVTVSGISAGAYMAGQMHVAHSSLISGAGMIAGGPYWCAGNSIVKAIGPCVKGGDVEQDRIIQYIGQMSAAGNIDETDNLAGDQVWLFHGTADAAVAKAVTVAAKSLYEQFIAPKQIEFVDSVDVVHGMPTIDVGAPCSDFIEPYLNACKYDAAGLMLTHLYGPLKPRTKAVSELRKIDQTGYGDAELWDYGYLYVPAACLAAEVCGLHIVFHGCQQSAEQIGDAFAAGAGYNEWAETNQLVVLYPQVRSSKVAPINPYGCWDWWGYTGENYATRQGAQVSAVKTMLDQLIHTNP